MNSLQADSDISQATNLSVLESLVDVPVLAIEHSQYQFEDLARHLW
jgi:hypothetical protein